MTKETSQRVSVKRGVGAGAGAGVEVGVGVSFFFIFLYHFLCHFFFLLGPDYMSRAGPVSRAASVWAGPVVM